MAHAPLRYNFSTCIELEFSMPISLRLPPELETQIASFGARQGLSKSAVIVRSIHEFLARHAQPSALQIYEEVMQEVEDAPAVARAPEQRSHKLQVREAIARKHAERSARASKALAAPRGGARKSA
jgi:predicted transcriptional regulator